MTDPRRRLVRYECVRCGCRFQAEPAALPWEEEGPVCPVCGARLAIPDLKEEGWIRVRIDDGGEEE